MATYNLKYSGSMAQSQNVYFYEDITSALGGDSTLIDSGTPGSSSNKTIMFYIRGRKTNWTRGISAYATVSEGFYRPTYLHNDRYWLLRLQFLYPTTSNITTYDTGTNRALGGFVAPVNETYDISLYYGAWDVKTFGDALTKIDGINIVLNVTVDETFSHIETDNPIAYYNEYSSNDAIERPTMFGSSLNKGLPTLSQADGGDGDTPLIVTDAQYGVQTWTPSTD